MAARNGETAVASQIRRRALLLGGAATAAAAWWMWPRVAPLLIGSFDFQPINNPSGFRRLAAGGTSGVPGPLVGLGDSQADADQQEQEMDAVRGDLCRALFGAPPAPGVVPIASFSDYNCPFCRVLTDRLSVIEAEMGDSVQMAWHEWPLLGPTSVLAARAALAADIQGAYTAFHRRLMRTRFVATPALLASVSEDIGIDPVRLMADMGGPVVADRLRETDLVARIFGLIGTPALVVGRTVVVGAVSDATVRALIAREIEEDAVPVCAI